jgi:hypothetical protein
LATARSTASGNRQTKPNSSAIAGELEGHPQAPPELRQAARDDLRLEQIHAEMPSRTPAL